MARTPLAARVKLAAIGVPCLVAVCLAPVAVRANEAAKAAAEVLFDQGKALMAKGRYAEACPKFAESQRLDAGIGTMLNLADCLEKTGKTASAWAEFRAAAGAAKAARHHEREQIARERAAALEKKLARLTLMVEEPAEDQAGLTIRQDGLVIGRPLWGTAMPVDPGVHAIEASAPGKQSWRTTIDVPLGKPALIRVTVPPLDDADGEREQRPFRWDPQRVAGVAAMGAGSLGLALGTIFGVRAIQKNEDSSAHCRPGNFCDATGVVLRREALDAGTASTATFAVGSVFLAGGLLLYWTAPSPRTPPATTIGILPAPNGANFVWRGVW